jgi:hypothetical protein
MTPSQTVSLVRRLRSNGVYFEQLIFPDEINDFSAARGLGELVSCRRRVFDRHLK